MKAVVSYDRAITLRPDYAAAFYNRGNVLHVRRRNGEALASYDQAIRLKPEPDYADAFNNRGTLQGLKRFDEALRCS
jgi:tetratricopeptide (TPR) repeat protein